jgi:hypothetical protein
VVLCGSVSNFETPVTQVVIPVLTGKISEPVILLRFSKAENDSSSGDSSLHFPYVFFAVSALTIFCPDLDIIWPQTAMDKSSSKLEPICLIIDATDSLLSSSCTFFCTTLKTVFAVKLLALAADSASSPADGHSGVFLLAACVLLVITSLRSSLPSSELSPQFSSKSSIGIASN